MLFARGRTSRRITKQTQVFARIGPDVVLQQLVLCSLGAKRISNVSDSLERH